MTALLALFKRSFHSKVVRLEGIKQKMNVSRLQGFNSKVVRLEEGHRGKRQTHENRFQFQSGSIRREMIEKGEIPF